jgi:hypothetical protein
MTSRSALEGGGNTLFNNGADHFKEGLTGEFLTPQPEVWSVQGGYITLPPGVLLHLIEGHHHRGGVKTILGVEGYKGAEGVIYTCEGVISIKDKGGTSIMVASIGKAISSNHKIKTPGT